MYIAKHNKTFQKMYIKAIITCLIKYFLFISMELERSSALKVLNKS